MKSTKDNQGVERCSAPFSIDLQSLGYFDFV